MSTSLPERPDLDQLHRQAKELRDAARSGDAGALARLARHHRAPADGAVSLAVAQMVVARELGFASWPKLRLAVDAVAAHGARVDEFLTASVSGRLRTSS
jgi:hypothetical protein